MMYHLIQTEACRLSMRRRCRIATVSASAYYAWCHQTDGGSTEDDLLPKIRQILEECAGYGYRRVTKELNRQGVVVNKKAVQRLMQKHHLQRRQKRRFVRTTDSKHGLPVYPNLIQDLVIDRPDQVWAADITYVRLVRGFVYVAVLLDLFSRKVIGSEFLGGVGVGNRGHGQDVFAQDLGGDFQQEGAVHAPGIGHQGAFHPLENIPELLKLFSRFHFFPLSSRNGAVVEPPGRPA